MSATVGWSVVIPAYNEARRLPRYLDEVCAFFDGRAEPYEVLVVDDGSADGTRGAVDSAGHRAVTVVRSEHNRGKGAAVRDGMLRVRGAYRLFSDADGATPIAELKRLESALTAGADVAIGSRALVDPAVAVVSRRHRMIAGRVFNWFVARAGVHGVADSQCGFKAFRAEAADDLFGRLRTRGFGFDVELLLLAEKLGYRIVEVPVNWVDQPGSKIRVMKDGPRMLAQIALARWRVARVGRGGDRR